MSRLGLRVLSLGAGVPSSTVLLAAEGRIPVFARAASIFFAALRDSPPGGTA